MLKYFFRGILNDPQLQEILEGERPVAYVGLWIQYALLVAFNLAK